MKRIVINKPLVLSEAQRVYGSIDINEEVLGQIMQYATIEKAKKHEIILNAGEVSDFFGFVLKGMVQTYYYKNNKLITDYFASEGYGFFEVNSFITGEPSQSFIEALEPTVYAKIPKEKFVELADSDLKIDSLHRRIMRHAVKTSSDRLNSILHETAEQKYANLEHRIPGLTSRVSAINIASYIGVTQETLCRIKSKQGMFI
ncbi:MAG: Crp/Fnr family transcriptional regulator [Paludibacteraceae bacterium]|nr:Crp/Fnr family transcriptional regulator [Paludibacteraceae bacterium]